MLVGDIQYLDPQIQYLVLVVDLVLSTTLCVAA